MHGRGVADAYVDACTDVLALKTSDFRQLMAARSLKGSERSRKGNERSMKGTLEGRRKAQWKVAERQ